MRLVCLLLLTAPAASAQIGDVLWAAHQFEGLDAPARTSMAVALGTTFAVPALATGSVEAGVPAGAALSIALAAVVVGPEAGFAAAGEARAGLVGMAVRGAAVGGTAVLLHRADLSEAGLGAPAVALFLMLPGALVVTGAVAIDQARLRDRLLAQTRSRRGGVSLGLVRGGPGVAVRLPL